ncbi:helix-turn-helix transcriptional regulator [Actinomadura sp. K4S16]|uniref:helix-turn-helix domain-containing protein n=1 Tax=Actinomadura sp. K4S16 TaxID=1316147 RepID=UPI0011ED80F9|nr:helix-turn-helix transcriptional regulator [Actinomadura sp. K4S16]
MTDGGSPTIRRRELGSRLRRLRLGSSKTIDEVAQALLCSTSKVSRIETGQRVATARDIRDLCDLYGVTDPAVKDELMRLGREARRRSWWRQYSDLGEVTSLLDYQEGASSITEYDSCLVPGLLQTADYARSALRGLSPSIREDVLEERIEVRMRRQSLLTRDDPPRLWVLLDESVLIRHVGGSATMKAQLNKLHQQSRLPQVTLQVVPFKSGAHPGLNSAFSLVEFTGAALSPIVYTEGLIGEIYLEGRNDIDRYREAVDHLRATALSPADSQDLITRMIGRLS